MIDHRIYAHDFKSSCEIKACTKKKKKKKRFSGLNGIRAHPLCDIGTVLYQLSYQANWKLVTL